MRTWLGRIGVLFAMQFQEHALPIGSRLR
jgi:hypothetical protein